MLEWCLHRSHALVRPRSAPAGDIWLRSRRRNAVLGLTGYLHREGETFVHYLEGPREALAAMAFSIRRDWRHDGLRRLDGGLLSVRRFADWDMAFTDEETRGFAAWAVRMGRSGPIETADPSTIGAFLISGAPSGAPTRPKAA